MFSFTPKNVGLSFLGAMHPVSADPVSYYSGSLIFNVQSPSSGSGGGCNAGIGSGATVLLALPLLGLLFLHRRTR